LHRELRPRTTINEILDRGRSLRTQEEIAQYVQNYYKELYRKDYLCEINIAARRDYLRSVPPMVSQEQNDSLTAPITDLEVELAIKALPTNKAAGPDGVPMEFYKETWELVGANIKDLMNETLEKGQLNKAIM
jgi:hypothetical protein